jgi:epoxyqueuosine reductase
VKFARELPDDSPFRPREALAGKDARTLARENLGMDVEGYRAAFRGSPTERAELPAMKRDAAAVLCDVGTEDNIAAPATALPDGGPLLRGHAALPLGRIGSAPAVEVPRARSVGGSDFTVLDEPSTALRTLGG